MRGWWGYVGRCWLGGGVDRWGGGLLRCSLDNKG